MAKKIRYIGARFCYGFIALLFGLTSAINFIVILTVHAHRNDIIIDITTATFIGLISYFAFKRYKYWCKQSEDYVEPKLDSENL
jgi:hypothetical protein